MKRDFNDAALLDMLKAKNLTGVLSQAVEHDKHSSIVSSILITTSGRPVASFHSTTVPPSPHTEVAGRPYQVDRTMKTKVYGLFASAVWDEYTRSSNTENGETEQTKTTTNLVKWTSVTTDDAMIVIYPLNLKTSSLLLLIVAEPWTPLGVVVKKAQETASVLQDGLAEFKVYD